MKGVCSEGDFSGNFSRFLLLYRVILLMKKHKYNPACIDHTLTGKPKTDSFRQVLA